jgi:hypothetical protein
VIRATTSASNIARRALCPGSERLEDGLPEEQSEQADEGVLLHGFMAEKGASRANLKPYQRDLLNTAERLVRQIFEQVQNQFGDLSIGNGGFERELWLHYGIKPLFPGHCDLWEYIAEKKLLIIVDHKFGYKIVTPAAANLQLRAYAAMGAEQHDCEHVVVAITQPRLLVEDRLTMAVYSRDDIKASRRQLYEIWDACKAPDAPLVAGEEQCRYCKAKLICPAYKAKIDAGTSIIPFPSTDLSRTAREAQVEQRLQQCSDEQLTAILEAVTFSEFIKELARDIARERIRAGQMSGYKLGKETEVREITDTAGAIRLALLNLNLPQEAVIAACKLAVGKIEEAYRETNTGCTWSDARDAVNTALAPVIERKTKKPAIEKVSERKALKAS